MLKLSKQNISLVSPNFMCAVHSMKIVRRVIESIDHEMISPSISSLDPKWVQAKQRLLNYDLPSLFSGLHMREYFQAGKGWLPVRQEQVK